jgi:hypothetical protein
VRTRVLEEKDLELLRQRFLADIVQRQFQVVRMTDSHYREAEQLIRKYGVQKSLRTLDALQLSVAVDLQKRGVLDYFVCADKHLCSVAIEEGLSPLNPEQP